MSQSAKRTFRLVPLTPRYQPEQHGKYVDAIMSAFRDDTDDKIRFVALTGQFGTGKSSVIEGLLLKESIQDMKPTRVSLGTITSNRTARNQNDTAPERSKNDDLRTPADVRNHIQKQIVEQLLYSQPNSTTPLSRYKRLSHTPKRKAFFQAVTAALILVLLSLVILLQDTKHATTWINIRNSIPILGCPGLRWLTSPGSLAVATIATLVGLAWYTYTTRLSTRIQWSELKTGSGPGSLTLKNEGTWFDEYVDEIVYHFDATDCRLVIFEDLDRFEDPELFEMIRDLNTLLNNSGQLARNGVGPIRFLCAVRDSVFSDRNLRELRNESQAPDSTNRNTATATGSAESEAARRIKLFDLIVPLIPFVSPRTARSHFDELLDEETKSDLQPVIRITSKYVTDYRLIATIVNEYHVLLDIVRSETLLHDLQPTNIFAMAAYKMIHPGDYEQILAGTSKLNELQRTLEEYRISHLNRLNEHRDRVLNVCGPMPNPEEREILDNVLQAILTSHQSMTARTSSGGLLYDTDSDDTTEFWTDAAIKGINFDVHAYPDWTPDQLARMTGHVNHAKSWDDQRTEQVQKDLSFILSEQDSALHASWSDLLRPREPYVFNSIGGEFERTPPSSVDALGLDALTLNLITEGYIDELFTVYAVRTDPGHLTPRTLNFLLSVAEAPHAEPQMMYDFGDNQESSIRNMLEEVSPSFLADRRCLNIQLFDYWLSPVHDRAPLPAILVASTEGDGARDFRRLYRSSGKHQMEFTTQIAEFLPSAFTEILDDLTGDATLEAHISASLRGSFHEADYETSNELLTFIRDHKSNIFRWDTESAESTAGADLFRRVSTVLGTLGYTERDLAEIPEKLARSLIERDLYDVNDNNLCYITASSLTTEKDTSKDYSIALDRIPTEYRNYVISQAACYAGVLRDNAHYSSIASTDGAVELLNLIGRTVSLDDADRTLLTERASHTSPWGLDALDKEWWTDAVKVGAVAITWPSLIDYFDAFGNIVPWLGALSRLDIEDIPDATSDLQVTNELLNALLTMREIDVDRRLAWLRASGRTLELSQIPKEDYPLIPRLVKDAMLPDDSTVFLAVATSPADLTGLARVSKEAAGYLLCVAIDGSTAATVVRAERPELTRIVLSRLHEITDLQESSAAALLEAARDLNEPLAYSQLLQIGNSIGDGATFELALPIVGRDLSSDDLRQLLGFLSGDVAAIGEDPLRGISTNHFPLLKFLKDKDVIRFRKEAHKDTFCTRPLR